MTPREFIIWFRGFVQAANGYNITPKQWDDVKDVLDKVEIDPIKGTKYVLDTTNWNVNTTSKLDIEESGKVF